MKLQKPEYVFMGGKLCPWDEARLHIGCEAVTRGLNVFEGVKAYRQQDGSLAIVKLRPHFDRLRRSAHLLQIPFAHSYEEFLQAIVELSKTVAQPGKEMWLRPTLFVTEGHWGENTVADLVITGYHLEMEAPAPIHLGISTWRRSPDVSLPARIKTSSNYQVARLARIEGRRLNCEDMVLLNQSGRVAEATASCLLIARDGVVITPPATEGALESITVNIIEELAKSLGIPFERRPIDRTELLVADGLAICGTLAEVVSAQTIEGRPLVGSSSLLQTLQQRYFAAVRGTEPHRFVELTKVTNSQSIPGPTPDSTAYRDAA